MHPIATPDIFEPDPTEQQIRELCWKIQDSWTDRERQLRAGRFAEVEVVAIPVVPEPSHSKSTI
ncbi:hypothetical protein Pla144_48030 [Bythopirellula polymerisocia]|uniref:Uncharacterized protein n=1 Tax=Bythopirellula polymerisocia TaxID=2528003 RepID=A0A5C6C9T4_9BACT|nr:hypothetical protein Pla144_48030 [Bythopirellula polymerisocia]